MNDYYPKKIKSNLKNEVEIEIDASLKIKEDTESWNNCYFHKVNSELYHEKGLCECCDWKRYIKNVSKEQLNNFNFIEAWEWHEYWIKNKSIND